MGIIRVAMHAEDARASLHDPAARKAMDARLARAEGQVRAIRRMIADEAPCEDIALQLAAARKALDRAFSDLTDGAAGARATLAVQGRTLVVPRAARGVARFDFAELCATALGAADYLTLATHYYTLIASSSRGRS